MMRHCINATWCGIDVGTTQLWRHVPAENGQISPFLDIKLPIVQENVIPIDSFHIVTSLSDRSSIEKSIKSFLQMKGQIAY